MLKEVILSDKVAMSRVGLTPEVLADLGGFIPIGLIVGLRVGGV